MLLTAFGKDLARDPDFAKRILEPPRFERVVGFTSDGIKVKILGTTTPNDTWDIRGEFYKRLIVGLRGANIQLPTAQITVQNTNNDVTVGTKKASKKTKS